MPRLTSLSACLVAALALTGSASGAVRVGVADDLGLVNDYASWFFDSLGDLGMTENRVSVSFDASDPATIQNRPALDTYLPLAALRGTRVVFSVAPSKAKGITETPGTVDSYATYVKLLAETYPTVTDFIVGNEPNQPRFNPARTTSFSAPLRIIGRR